MYEVRFTTKAKKDLKSQVCRPYLKKILQEISILQKNPLAGSCLKGSLAKVRSLHFNIKGSGEWRIAYYIMTTENNCLILLVGTRENFYKKAQRRFDSIKKA